MSTLKQLAGSTTNCVTSGGGVSSAAAAAANGASNLVNSTNLDFMATARLTAAAGSTPTQGATVSLYLVPKADGSSVAAVDATTPFFSPNYFVGFFYWPLASGASSSIMDIPNIPLEAYDYEPYIVNNLGQSISSGWTLSFFGTKNQY